MDRRNADGFIGAYAPVELKKALQEEARKNHRTLSGEVISRLEQSLQQPTQENPQ